MNLLTMTDDEIMQAMQEASERRKTMHMSNEPLTKDANFLAFILDGYKDAKAEKAE